MFRLTKKGQASSTFQLLIAAVVALAILGVLLSILNVIPGLNADPTKSTKTLLSSQISNPGAESCTDAVTFTRSKSTISAEGITLNTGLELGQVYFANPEDISNFDVTSPQLLRYTSTTSKKVIVCIICSGSIENLEAAITANSQEGDAFGTTPKLPDDQTLCVVYPRKTSST